MQIDAVDRIVRAIHGKPTGLASARGIMELAMNTELQSQIERLRAELPELRRRYGVSGLWVFGSRSRDEGRTDSDLDLLVEFAESRISLFGFVALEQDISDMLGVKVDLVQRSAVRQELRSAILAEAIAV